MKTWKEVSPFSGIEEDAPVNSVAGGGVDMSPDAVKGKKKLLDRHGSAHDARTKGYKEHRNKLEAARLKRAEWAKQKGKMTESVTAAILDQEYNA
jgi:hypothetical protein